MTEILLPGQKEQNKLEKKYSGAKKIEGGHYANIKDRSERVKLKYKLLTDLRLTKKMGGGQSLRFNQADLQFKEQEDKINSEIERLNEEMMFWWGKRAEVLEDTLDIQLAIIQESIIK